MNQVKEQFIVQTIEAIVRQTSLPVAAQVLTASRIATRAELRKLERVGRLKGCHVTKGRGIMNAYYTEGAVPHAIRVKQSEYSEPAEPSEVLDEEPSKSGS